VGRLFATRLLRTTLFGLFLVYSNSSALRAGEYPRTLRAYPGTKPVLDGVISPNEWDDGTQFAGLSDWVPQFSPAVDPKDLSLRGYVKHDGERLYFTDDVLYGIDTPRWLPDVKEKAAGNFGNFHHED
jgi:hypothetical protein